MKRLGVSANAGILLALVLALAFVALAAAPNSPPSIAEFAPQAQDTIEESLAQQSSQFGDGNGTCFGLECPLPDVSTPDGPTPKPRPIIEVGRVRRCVGQPPRQIEDPQSPPCVNYFDGDNGGATWAGVTRDEIRIAYPKSSQAIYEVYGEFFNRRFEFYGRRLVMVPYEFEYDDNDDGITATNGAVAAKATKPFAVATFPAASSWIFHREMARSRILSVTTMGAPITREFFSKWSPYVWAYQPPADEALENMGEFVCQSLAGKPAAYAGVGLVGQPRKFGALRADRMADDGDPVEPVSRAMKECGATIPVVLDAPEEVWADDQDFTAFVARFQTEGVTTVLCPMSAWTCEQLMDDAERLGYQPEWVRGGPGSATEYDFAPVLNADQRAQQRAFGLLALNKFLPDEQAPWNVAAREVDPEREYTKTLSFSTYQYQYDFAYRAMLVLASGIQMAGPKLTPETFAAGLRRTVFPNPACGQAPYYQPCSGFQGGSHSMIHDNTVVWWSPSQRGDTHDGTGSWCFVDRGARWGRRGFPPNQALFDRTKPCR